MYKILDDLSLGNATPYTYNRNIAQYFENLNCEANYLLANMYIKNVVESDLRENNTIKLIDNNNSRITKFLKTLDNIYDEENFCIKISDSSNLSLSEKQAILAIRTANTSFNSFAAEVIYHAKETNSAANIIIDFDDCVSDPNRGITDGALVNSVINKEIFKHAVKADLGYGEEKESFAHISDPYYDNNYDVIKALKEMWGDI